MVNNLKNTFNKQNTLITLSALLMCLGSLSLDAATTGKSGTGKSGKAEPGDVDTKAGGKPTVFKTNKDVINTETGKEEVKPEGFHIRDGIKGTTPSATTNLGPDISPVSTKEINAEASKAAKEVTDIQDAAKKFTEASTVKKKTLQDDSTVITKQATEEAESALETLAAEVVKENMKATGKKELPSNDPAHEGMGTLKGLVAEIIQKDFTSKDKEPTAEDKTIAVSKASDIYLKMKVLETNDPKKLAQELTPEQKADLEKKKKEFCKCLGTCGI